MEYLKNYKLTSNVWVILLLFSLFLIHHGSTQSCNANPESGDFAVAGRCVTFPECPTLFNLIRSKSITAKEIKLLQRLTCLQDSENPTICCPLKGIKELANYEGKPAIEPSKRPMNADDVLHLPKGDDDGLVLTLGVGADVHDRNSFKTVTQNKQHKNLALLPKLEECGISSALAYSQINDDRIIGGMDSDHAEYPWMARIGYRSVDNGDIEFYCGATVISRKYVITAAHCTQEIDLSEYRPAVIRLGEHNATNDVDCSPHFNCSRAVDLKIEKMIPHPGYSVADKANDIELIRVHGNIPFNTPFVQPICLPLDDQYGSVKISQVANRMGVITGWGKTRWNRADGSSVLQKVHLPIVTNEECQKNYSTKIEISEQQMCAGGIKNQDSCGGDSGGPLAISIPIRSEGNPNLLSLLGGKTNAVKLRPKFFQLGVVSFGPVQCGVGGLPGVYTRISSYKQWILDNLEP